MDDQSFSQVPAPAQAPKNSSLAIVSLVCGIVGLCLPLLGGIVAVITGHMAKKEIRASGDTLGGNGMATAGLVLGYLELVVYGGICCVYVLLIMLGPSIGNVFSNILLGI